MVNIDNSCELDPNSKAILEASAQYAINNYARTGTIVDVGCGEGRLLRRLQQNGFTNLAGIGYCVPDLDGIRVVNGVDLCKEGWADLTEVKDCELVISTEVIEHLTNPFLYLQEIGRMLKPDGELLLTFPNVHNFRSIVGYALTGRYSGFFGPNFNDGHPLFDQHIFIPNIHLVHYFLKTAGFSVVEERFVNGTGRLFSQTALLVARNNAK